MRALLRRIALHVEDRPTERGFMLIPDFDAGIPKVQRASLIHCAANHAGDSAILNQPEKLW